MTRITPLVAIVCLCLCFSACAGSSGFQQAELRAPLTMQPHVNDSRVEQAFALAPQLPRPYRLGVYFREALSADGETVWRWKAQHRAAVLDLGDRLEDSGEVSAVFSIGQSTVIGDNLTDIRVAAARHGADAVLVVSGIDEADRSENAWAVSYATLVPMFFAPGSELDVVFSASAEMWDVRNEYLYLGAEAEAEAHQQRALPYIDREEAVAETQAEAMELLGAELSKRFNRLHAL